VDGAEYAVGYQGVVGTAACDQAFAQRLGLAPVAQLAQDVRQAAEAGLLERAALAAPAQADRRAQGVAGAAVVPGNLVGGTQTLVHLGGLCGQLVLERERQARADDLDALAVRAPLDAGDALEPHRARTQVDPLGADRLLAGQPRHRFGLRVRPGALQISRDDKALRRRLRGQPVRLVGIRGDAARG
jgi:hypothetical protein